MLVVRRKLEKQAICCQELLLHGKNTTSLLGEGRWHISSSNIIIPAACVENAEDSGFYYPTLNAGVIIWSSSASASYRPIVEYDESFGEQGPRGFEVLLTDRFLYLVLETKYVAHALCESQVVQCAVEGNNFSRGAILTIPGQDFDSWTILGATNERVIFSALSRGNVGKFRAYDSSLTNLLWEAEYCGMRAAHWSKEEGKILIVDSDTLRYLSPETGKDISSIELDNELHSACNWSVHRMPRIGTLLSAIRTVDDEEAINLIWVEDGVRRQSELQLQLGELFTEVELERASFPLAWEFYICPCFINSARGQLQVVISLHDESENRAGVWGILDWQIRKRTDAVFHVSQDSFGCHQAEVISSELYIKEKGFTVVKVTQP